MNHMSIESMLVWGKGRGRWAWDEKTKKVLEGNEIREDVVGEVDTDYRVSQVVLKILVFT